MSVGIVLRTLVAEKRQKLVEKMRQKRKELTMSAEERFLYNLGNDLGGDGAKVVSEFYSPPRVTAAARRLKSLAITPGFAMYLTTTDENGVPWNFDSLERRRAARAKFDREKPMFVIGSPMCTRFCGWQSLNDLRKDAGEVHRDHVRAMVHLRSMMQI